MGEFGNALLVMFFVVALLRATIVTFGALIEEQVIVPGFFMMMRWQSHKHVIGQSLSFFQNDLAGRISQKVFQSGMATGDMMISLLQVIWFVVIYAVTTAGLLFSLDWQLGLVIAIWSSVAFVLALVLRLQLLSGRLLGNLNGFFRNVGVTQNTMDLVAKPHQIKDHWPIRCWQDDIAVFADAFL